MSHSLDVWVSGMFLNPVEFCSPLKITVTFSIWFTKLFVVYTLTADCSLGEVKQSLEASGELRGEGLYLMPEAVTCNGDLVLVQTCGFLNKVMETTLFRLIMREVVYRERTDTHELEEIYRQNLDIQSNATQGCGNFSQRLSVKKGDRVGMQLQDTCDTPDNSDPACSAQANLIDTACASALYLPPRSRPRTLSDFTVVGVNLNMRVSIGECTLRYKFVCNLEHSTAAKK